MSEGQGVAEGQWSEMSWIISDALRVVIVLPRLRRFNRSPPAPNHRQTVEGLRLMAAAKSVTNLTI